MFVHGVASGDPSRSGVTIWTAVSGQGRTVVEYEVALDADFESIVASGTIEPTDQGELVDDVLPAWARVDGLTAQTEYHYRFGIADQRSPVGRCTTLPEPQENVERVRVGLASCARLASAPFDAYAGLARREPDLVVHLGDYIYEDGSSPHDPPFTCEVGDDYRRRYAQYRREEPLQELHRVAPWVSVWDDHDIADDSWRTGAADSEAGRRDWERRRRGAEAAYLEWLPQSASDRGPTTMDRRLRLGSLADVVVLDARNAARARPVSESGPALVSPDDDRQIISEAQWNWLNKCVEEADGWLVVCTQTQVAPLRLARLPNPRRRFRLEPFVNPGQWDGYPVERDRLVATLAPVAGRVLLCSGDLHGRFHTALELGDGLWAPEVTTPSIASTPFADAIRATLPIPTPFLKRWLHLLNPHVSHMDLEGRGSTVLEIGEDAIDVIALGTSGDERCRWRIGRGDSGRPTLRHR